jgi:AcrR family transcriptional regulator
MVNSSSKLRDRIREATADAILSAAEDVFADSGVHQAKVDEIATRAGVSVGTLYNYFPDREGLLCSLIQTRRSDIQQRMDEAMVAAEGKPFREQLAAFFQVGFEHFDQHRKFFSIVFQSEMDRKPLTEKHSPREAAREFYDRTRKLVDRGLESGELRPELGDLLPGLLMSLWKAALMSQFYENNARPMSDRTQEFVDFIMNGAGVRHG